MTLLGAGHDTTATGIAWTLDQLSKHPYVQRKLRSEIQNVLPKLSEPQPGLRPVQNTTPDVNMNSLVSNVDNLPYLDNVCRESLRFNPPIPLTLRRSRKSANLVGYDIPGGTLIFVAGNTINRLTKYWGPSANSFNSNRWDNLPGTW